MYILTELNFQEKTEGIIVWQWRTKEHVWLCEYALYKCHYRIEKNISNSRCFTHSRQAENAASMQHISTHRHCDTDTAAVITYLGHPHDPRSYTNQPVLTWRPCLFQASQLPNLWTSTWLCHCHNSSIHIHCESLPESSSERILKTGQQLATLWTNNIVGSVLTHNITKTLPEYQDNLS